MSRIVDQSVDLLYNYTLIMKKNIHPTNYRLVVFEDLNDGTRILTRSTVASEDTTKWEDGQEYPLIKVHISSSSHPFYTGQEKLVDIEGRVDKFKAKREAAENARKARAEKAATQKKSSAVEKKDEKPEVQKIG